MKIQWSFRCNCGTREHGPFKSAAEASDFRAALKKDGHRPGKIMSSEPLYEVPVFGDIGEHYNAQFDQVVRGRQQWRRLQDQYGTSDYDPKKQRAKQSENWRTKRDETPDLMQPRDKGDDAGPPLVLPEYHVE